MRTQIECMFCVTAVHTKCNLFLSLCHSLFYFSPSKYGQRTGDYGVFNKNFDFENFIYIYFFFFIFVFVGSLSFFSSSSSECRLTQYIPSSRKMTRRFLYILNEMNRIWRNFMLMVDFFFSSLLSFWWRAYIRLEQICFV